METLGEPDHPLLLEHRKQLFGQAVIHTAPERFWELKVIHHLPGGKLEWDQMNTADQQERIAFVQLENMVATLDAHYRIIEQNKKAEERAGKANQTSKSRKR